MKPSTYIDKRKNFLTAMDELAHKEFQLKKLIKQINNERNKLLKEMKYWDNKLIEI